MKHLITLIILYIRRWLHRRRSIKPFWVYGIAKNKKINLILNENRYFIVWARSRHHAIAKIHRKLKEVYGGPNVVISCREGYTRSDVS
jgi:hypothetical protein